MAISRRNRKVSERRTIDYRAVLLAAGNSATAPPDIAAVGVNLLLFTTDLSPAVTAGVGGTVSFFVRVTAINSDAAISYTWQTSPDGEIWTNVAGAVTNTYTRTVTAGDNNLRVRVVATQLLRVVQSSVSQISVVPTASSVFGLEGPAATKISITNLSVLFSDFPLDPMNVSQTRVATMTLLPLFSDPFTGAGGANTKIATSNLSLLLSQPNGVENILAALLSTVKLDVLFSDELDAAGIFSVVNNETIFTVAGTTFSKNVGGLAATNYTYAAANLPNGLSINSAGLITGAVISDANFEQTATVTATHTITNQAASVSLLFSHSQFAQSASSSVGLTRTPPLSAAVYSGDAVQVGAQEFRLTIARINYFLGGSGRVDFANDLIVNSDALFRKKTIKFSFDWRAWDSQFAVGAEGIGFEFAPEFIGPIVGDTTSRYSSPGFRVVIDTFANVGGANSDHGIRCYIDDQLPIILRRAAVRTAEYTNLTLEIDREARTLNYTIGPSSYIAAAQGSVSLPSSAAVLTPLAYTWPAYFSGQTGYYNDTNSIKNFTVNYT